jgi:phosphate-selective porin OprO and OprP
MRVLWRLWTTLAVCLGLCMATGVHAQSQFQTHPVPGYPASYTADSAPASMVNWETNYSALEQRIWELERAAKEKEGAHTVSSAKTTQKWGGRVHFDYWPTGNGSPLANYLETTNAGNDPEDFIGFRRLRFGVGGDIGDTMEYKIEMEWANPENPAIKDAYLGWNELPVLRTLLLGNQKRPYGLDHLNSSRYNVFMERPYVVEAFNADARRLGLCSYGVSKNEAWNWRYGVFTIQDLQKPGFQRTDNYQMEIAGRLANTIWYDESSDGRGYAHWAISGSAAYPNSGPSARFQTRPEARMDKRWFDTGAMAGAEDYQLVGLEGVINLGSLSVVGEYMGTRVNRIGGREDVDFGGGYVYVAYFLTGEHTPWERKSGTLGRTKPFENFFLVRRCDGGLGRGWGAWQVAARYSYGDFSDGNNTPDDILGGVGESFTLGLNWWWNSNARMQFNYIHGRISDRDVTTTTGIPPVVPPIADTSGNYDIFGMRFMCDF